MEWVVNAPAALQTGKSRYPLCRGQGGPQGWSESVRKTLLPPEFDPRAVQPVASRYTDWAIRAHQFCSNIWFCDDALHE
jgi:hypothetical protein